MNVPGDRDIKYSYDELHNRTTLQHGFGQITYNYDEGGMNFLQSYTEDSGLTVKYTYDKQGNPVYKAYVTAYGMGLATENYTWNERDELVSITGRVTENYTQDYKHRRVIKDSDGKISKYVYLQNDQVAIKQSPDHTDVFIYEGANRIAKICLQNDNTVQTEYMVNNYQGTPIALIDDEGEIRLQQYRDPFGNLEMAVGNVSSNLEFVYTGKEYDGETELFDFWNRPYGSVDGRFMGRDRVHLEDDLKNYFGINPYVFVNNNPIRNIDPDGNTVAEVLYYIQPNNWAEVVVMKSIEEDSFRATQEYAAMRFKENPSLMTSSAHNNEFDAYRHAYLAIETTRELGKEDAITVLTAHEKAKGLPKNEVQMDMHNNMAGINAASDLKNEDISAADLAKQLINNGSLMLKPDQSLTGMSEYITDIQ
jgi:RHS repeat-associated protein